MSESEIKNNATNNAGRHCSIRPMLSDAQYASANRRIRPTRSTDPD
jgi:hypothetical protein